MTADAPLVIADAEMLTGDPPRFLERDVVIDAGRIVAITRRGAATAPGAQVVRAPGRALLPGLINAHTHAYGQVCRCVPAKRLEAWLPLARAAASTMTADAHGVAVQLNVLDNLRHGVTTSLDHASLTPEILGETIDGYRRSHARVVLAAQTSDLGPAPRPPSP
jgi:5-methylthioadenosine/S-adenosylhomocysteine deaminase